LPLNTSKQDCASARAKLPPVDPWLSAAHTLMGGEGGGTREEGNP
jgi:hypothetical protein